MSGERLNDSTRHLSAGVYIDATYRDRLIRDVYLDRARRVAPSYGFALEIVLIHARRAVVHQVTCDALLLGSVVAGLLLAPASTVAALLVLVVWHISRAASRLSHDYVRYYVRHGTIDEYTHLQQRLKILRLTWRGIAAVPVLLVVGLGLAAGRHLTLPSKIVPVDITGLARWTITILGAQTLVAIILATAQHISVRQLRTGSAPPVPIVNQRVREIMRQEAEPITVYSKFRPFIGSGVEVRTWSFVQRLIEAGSTDLEGRREWENAPFRTVDIVGHLKRQISLLSHDPDSETRLSGLTVTHRIFVSGTKTADLPEDIADADPIRVMADPTGHARHYLACQIESWDGEVVTTVYVHASIQGRMLYLEFSTWALPPTRPDFHVMDQPGGVGVIAYATRVGREIGSLPGRIGGALPRLATHLVRALRVRSRSADNYDTRCRGVDIGARVSARELGAGLDIDNEERPSASAAITYFQHRDVHKYAKVIERRLLASVLDFLEERSIDVSEYRQRMVSILNIGAVNYGSGHVTVAGSAIGEGATVNNN